MVRVDEAASPCLALSEQDVRWALDVDVQELFEVSNMH